ncbi:E3 ubiquitin-protein ligase MARCHF7-like [Uloborus diversus]|uniref:E3 ubiquitin-protein ligase MARCHF7-like n=1 Tax=Uloborus diversus TaxID=327109 RepID=UPI00240953E0|nr:E3 ubiquitin-protein ligase MARCHF7-like [Uloborus diversus]XP_054708834.1 E3 ubiquitin-protein ligase MARCHF7-like [Uloborus diversus]
MCALYEFNCIPSSQNRLTDNAIKNMALVQSLNCASDHLSCDSAATNLKAAKPYNEAAAASLNCANTSLESQHLVEKSLVVNDKKSLYMSKACKYSFIASDYTSPEGQKLLSIKICQKPPENDGSASKGKNFLSKRSISEYFLSKNGVEKEMHDDRHTDSLLKSWQRTLFKPQVLLPHPIDDHNNCDTINISPRQDSEQDVTISHSVANDMPLPSNKSSYSLQMQQDVLNSLDNEPCASGTFKECNEDRNIYSGTSDENLPLKNYNLNPNVNFKVFDIESLSESGEPCDNGSVENNAHFGLDDAWFIPSARHTFSGADISGSASAAQLSIASSFGDNSLPTCKICHTAAKPDDPLISPCRCTGTLRYIHCGCLMKWLEICNKRSRKPPTCELCKYQFHWHKKFKVGQWQFPHCSWQDKILHTVFLISVLIMIGCAVVTVMCFKQHRGTKAEITHLELTQSEIITLICGALFFLAFFLAMYVEIKARNTIYKLMLKFIYLNQQWYIDEYDKKKENAAIDV